MNNNSKVLINELRQVFKGRMLIICKKCKQMLTTQSKRIKYRITDQAGETKWLRAEARGKGSLGRGQGQQDRDPRDPI